MINIALLQMDVDYCNLKNNYEKVNMMFTETMSSYPNTDIIVLPEDWSTGFSDEMFHNQEEYVENEDGRSINFLKSLALKYKVWVIGGSIGTLHNDGEMRNTTYIIDRNGRVIGDYSKIHLYSDMDEDFKLKHGNKADIYQIEDAKVGLMICYDIRFPELARIYSIKGSNVLFVTSEFPLPRTNHWRTLLMARAIENQVFVVACNRVGDGPMGTYIGHSMIIDPWGEIIAEAGEDECIVYGSIDLSMVDIIRDTIHVFRDRRNGTYKKLGLLSD